MASKEWLACFNGWNDSRWGGNEGINLSLLGKLLKKKSPKHPSKVFSLFYYLLLILKSLAN